MIRSHNFIHCNDWRMKDDTLIKYLLSLCVVSVAGWKVECDNYTFCVFSIVYLQMYL